MYVCLCKGITEKELQKASCRQERGTEVCRRLGVGSECGLCLESALELIQDKKVSQHKRPYPVLTSSPK